MRIYFDNAASTPISEEVLATITEHLKESFGNPSSIHADGRKGRTIIEEARKIIANHLNASLGEIFFTSGGSESNNMAVKCAVRDLGIKTIISSPIEHHCVLHALESLEEFQDVKILHIQLDQKGRVDLENLKELVSQNSENSMVSLMHANNEIGSMVNLQAVADICKEHGVLLHSDTVQTVGRFPIDVQETTIGFLSGSAHKFHGPKGVGFIYINSENIIGPYINGGSQERNMRAGTENTAFIAGMAKAFDLANLEMESRTKKIKELRQYLIDQLQSNFDDLQFNGDWDGQCLYTVISVSFPATAKTDLMVFSLDIAGISASGGSACSSGVETGSHVMSTLIPDDLRKTVRFSFSHYNSKEEIDILIEKLREIID